MALVSNVLGRTRAAWKRSVLHRAMLVALPVVLILLASYWKISTRGPVVYYSARVEQGDISQGVQSTGTINAVTTVLVGSQVSGTISQMSVDFNSRVKKGQVIAQIDPAILKARLLQAEADLTNAQASVRSFEAQIETQRADVQAAKAGVDRAKALLTDAELNSRRNKELFEQGIVSAALRDTAQANYESAAAGVKVAEAQLDQARARLKSMQANMEQAKAQVQQRKAAAEMARVDLAHTTIIAPIDGTVIARNVDIGQTVAASFQAPTLFIIAQDLTKMLVYAKTDEADVGRIKVGATANFRVDSFPNRSFPGTVIQVRMNATTVQNVVTYDTIIEFDNPDERLFPGMTAYVTIPIAEAKNVVKIPNGALRFKPDLTESDLKKLYEKYKIPYEDPRAQRLAGAGGPGGPSKAGESAGGPGGQPVGGGRPAGDPAAGGGEQRRMSGGMAGMRRFGPQIVWKLSPSKELLPVMVRLGVTDYTFTELREVVAGGELKPDDELIIGQSSTGSQAQAGPGGFPGRPGGPMGSPMNAPGGMRRTM
ncbi:MAG: efflux RND transporter periplasmic adaptor subunit [Acidobacteria bacterium]|nr:efflux RND transporter periplasmic adaptor subunit [Acidobacteriota bacterium]MBI3662017.1 efflux RND transporter periplasmic adaptor subunit [Acidobacteriota bacterium]